MSFKNGFICGVISVILLICVCGMAAADMQGGFGRFLDGIWADHVTTDTINSTTGLITVENDTQFLGNVNGSQANFTGGYFDTIGSMTGDNTTLDNDIDGNGHNFDNLNSTNTDNIYSDTGTVNVLSDADWNGHQIKDVDLSDFNTSSQKVDFLFRFNENHGNLTSSSVNDYILTINNWNDTVESGWVDTYEYHGIAFDGANDYLITSQSILQYNYTDSFYIFGKIKTNKSSGIQRILTKQTTTGYIIVATENGYIKWYLQDIDGNTKTIIGDDYFVSDNSPHIFYVDYNYATKITKIYVDGNIETISASTSFTNTFANSMPLQIGAYSTNQYMYNGTIDYIGGGSGVLSESDIRNIDLYVVTQEDSGIFRNTGGILYDSIEYTAPIISEIHYEPDGTTIMGCDYWTNTTVYNIVGDACVKWNQSSGHWQNFVITYPQSETECPLSLCN